MVTVSQHTMGCHSSSAGLLLVAGRWWVCGWMSKRASLAEHAAQRLHRRSWMSVGCERHCFGWGWGRSRWVGAKQVGGSEKLAWIRRGCA